MSRGGVWRLLRRERGEGVAGEAIAAVKGATVVDAVVTASAASRVLASAFDDP